MEKSVVRIEKSGLYLIIKASGLMPMLLMEEIAKKKLAIQKIIHHPSKDQFKVNLSGDSLSHIKVRDYINANI